MTLSLVRAAALAALQGLSEALPISRSGHEMVARIWLDGDDQAVALEGMLHAGTALAFAVIARRRLAAILRDGIVGAFRGSALHASAAAEDARLLAVAIAVSLGVDRLLGASITSCTSWSSASEAPAAAGLGMCATAFALASTLYVPRPTRLPTLFAKGGAMGRAAVVGLLHGLAAFPGASRVGVALAALLWFGVRAGRALDLAFLLTIPSLVVSFAQASAMHAVPTPSGAVLALGLVIAAVSAGAASELARSLAERRRVGVLSLWVLPLGLATLAYARALNPSR